MNIVSKVTGDSLTANEFNQIPDEMENLITSGGISPSDLDLQQITKAIAQYCADGNFYVASGTANAIILSTNGTRIPPVSLTNGFKARFKAVADNTGNCTINVANLGAKSIYFDGNQLQAGEIKAGNFYEVEYDFANDYFVIKKEVYQSIKSYDVLSSLVADTTIKDGDICITSGYYSVNDGGAGLYAIREQTVSDVEDGGSIIFISNSLVAELIVLNGIVSVKQFGAKGDDNNDDTNSIQNAINFSQNTNRYSVFIPSGIYRISQNITIDGVIVKGNGKFKTKIKYMADVSITSKNYSDTYEGSISDLSLEAQNIAKNPLKITKTDHAIYSNLRINNPLENGVYIYSTQYGWVENLQMSHVEVRWAGHNAFYFEVQEDSGFINECTFYQCEVRGVSQKGNGYNGIRVDNLADGVEVSCITWIDCNFDAKRKESNDAGFEIGEMVRLQNTNQTYFKCIGWTFISGGWETTTNRPFYDVPCFNSIDVYTNAWFVTSQNLAGWGRDSQGLYNINGLWLFKEALNLYNNMKLNVPQIKVLDFNNPYVFNQTKTNSTLVAETFEFTLKQAQFVYKRMGSSVRGVRNRWQEIEISLVHPEWPSVSDIQYYWYKFAVLANSSTSQLYLKKLDEKIIEDRVDAPFTITVTPQLVYNDTYEEYDCKIIVNVTPYANIGTGGRNNTYQVRCSAKL